MSESERQKRLMSEAEFHNRLARERPQGKAKPRNRYYYLAKTAFAYYRSILTDVEGKRILVAGCDEGWVTPLARKGARVVGIDIAEEAILRLNDSIQKEGLQRNARALVMNAEQPDFPPNEFDLICCSGVLHHLDIQTAIPSWAKILRPEGKVAMIEPMALNPGVWLYRIMTPGLRTPDEHPLKPRDIRFLRRHFRNVRVTGFALCTLFSSIFVFLPCFSLFRERTLRYLTYLDNFLFRALPVTKYLCWIVVIEAKDPV